MDTPPRAPSTRFRFKRRRTDDKHGDADDSHASRHRKRRRRSDEEPSSSSSHRREHKKHHSQSRSQRYPTPPPHHRDPSLSPETAFRESLFDAMADDEGAAFWEGVYGQPLHIYPDPNAASHDEGGEENIHRMDDDEYAAYVRAKMWEKTHEATLEEMRQREQARQRAAAQERERIELQTRITESMKFHEERKRQKAWKDAWKRYTSRWERLTSAPAAADVTEKKKKKKKEDNIELDVPWPTESGRLEDVFKNGEVRRFFDRARHEDGNAAAVSSSASSSKGQERMWLKSERIRWHPDKLQHRLGSALAQAENAKEIMSAVTAVFQILDDMWTSNNSTTTRSSK